MRTQTLEYRDGDLNLRGFLAFDDKKSGRRPGVLVMPEAFGLGAQVKRRVERLAELGYVALAGDPYGDGLQVSDLQEAIKRATALFADPSKSRARARAALDKLASLPEVDPSRLASIGYCMGGTLSLELARDGAPVKGIVSFHGGLQTQRPSAGEIKAKILVCTGADDPFVPVAQVSRAGRRDDQGQGGLADHQLCRHGAQLHQSRRGQDRRARNLLQQVCRRAVVEGDGVVIRGDFRGRLRNFARSVSCSMKRGRTAREGGASFGGNRPRPRRLAGSPSVEL